MSANLTAQDSNSNPNDVKPGLAPDTQRPAPPTTTTATTRAPYVPQSKPVRPKYVDPYASATTTSATKPPQSTLPPRSALPPATLPPPPLRSSRGVFSETATSTYPHSRDAQSATNYRSGATDYRSGRDNRDRDDHRSSRGGYDRNDRYNNASSSSNATSSSYRRDDDYDRSAHPLSRDRDREYSNRRDIEGYSPYPRSSTTTPSSSSYPHDSSQRNSLPTTTRQYRRLYVGNLPEIANMTDAVIRRYFTVCMEKLGFTTPDPVVDVSFSSSPTAPRNFCFVEFRSVVDTDAVFQLMNNIKMGDCALRLSRPREFVGVPPDLKDFILGHSPGEFKPPPQYNGQLPLLDESSRGGNHTPSMSRSNSTMINPTTATPVAAFTLPPLPAGELTIQQEIEWIAGLAKMTLTHQVSQYCPLLTPIPLVNQQLLTQHDPSNNQVQLPSSTVLKIPNVVAERGVNDLEWLNLADNFCHYINDELEAVFQSQGKRQFFTQLIIPRPVVINPVKEGEDGPSPQLEFDPTTALYTPTTLIAPDGTPLPFSHQVFGPQTALAQEHLGSVFIACTSQAVAGTLFDILNRVLYSKQLLRAQYSTTDLIEQLHQSMVAGQGGMGQGEAQQHQHEGLSTVMEDDSNTLF